MTAKGPSTDLTVLVPKPGDWATRGHCAGSPDPDLWHSDGAAPERVADTELARAICKGCPVRLACREYALRTPTSQDWGVWGATTANERRNLRRKMAKAAA